MRILLGLALASLSFCASAAPYAYISSAGTGTPFPNYVTIVDLATNTMTTATTAGAPNGVAISPDGQVVYVMNNVGDSVSRMKYDGTGVTTLVPSQDQPIGVAVDSSHLYWSDTDIFAAGLDGTNPHSLITGLNFGPAGLAIGPQ